MANIEVHELPEELHERLTSCAAAQGRSVGALVVKAIEREVSTHEWYEQYAAAPSLDIDIDAADLIRQERNRRDAHLAALMDRSRLMHR